MFHSDLKFHGFDSCLLSVPGREPSLSRLIEFNDMWERDAHGSPGPLSRDSASATITVIYLVLIPPGQFMLPLKRKREAPMPARH